MERRSKALFSVQTLLVLLLVAMLSVLLAFWSLGLGFDNGKAAVASLFTVLVVATIGEFIRRSRFRIGLKGFLAAFTAITILLGVYSQRLVEVRRQHDFAQKIQQLGGRVDYDYQQISAGWLRTKNGVLLPTWLCTVFGDDLFANVTSVSLQQSEFQDADLTRINHALSGLEDLTLIESRITGEGMKHLNGLENLQTIMIDGCQANELGFTNLSRLKNIEEVVIIGLGVTDANLDHIGEIPNLRRLTLWNTNISDHGLRHLRELNRLEFLNLNSPRLGDPGLVHLKTLTTLKAIHLEGTAISECGIMHLKDLPNLKKISSFRNAITEDGVESLRKAMPSCDIRL